MWLRFMYLYALWLSDSDVPSNRANILNIKEEEKDGVGDDDNEEEEEGE